MVKDKIYTIDREVITRFGIGVLDTSTIQDSFRIRNRKPEQTLRQKAIQVQNNVDVICDILELIDKIENEL